MDKAALVDVDITSGKKILDILDKAGFKVIVALWLYTSEFEAWRLYIASPVVEAEGITRAYLRLLSALRSSDDPDLASRITITLLSPKEPLIRAFRRTFARAAEVKDGVRLSSQVISDGVFVEQAYLYRVA
ncbi:MAG TPA: hypothetical protein VNY30_10105 [Bryobacteraceae bacterium]|nr:hypothetical protein [Bryobacteraceae bacterium]